MPFPIQSGSITERLRKFFRIRGKTSFSLDEMVSPVVLVQDLTQGPYQAGVTPCAGTLINTLTTSPWSFVILLNDKVGSITPVLDTQFKDRSFSVTWIDFQNATGIPAIELANLRLKLSTRAQIVAAGVPTDSEQLVQIQNNDGSRGVPVEIFTYAVEVLGRSIWRGVLGDNINTLGSIRTLADITPNLTLGPDDALVLTGADDISAGSLFLSIRGFYQEQPA